MKKITSLVLALSLMLTMLCTTAFAAGEPAYQKVSVSAQNSSISVSSTYKWVTKVDSKNYTYLIKVANAAKKPAAYIFPGSYTAYNAENGDGSWMKTTMEIVPKTDLTNVKVSPLITTWGYMDDAKALGDMSAGKSYIVDVVFDQANSKMYVYKDGVCIANGDSYSTAFGTCTKGCIYLVADNNGYAVDTEVTELKNVAIAFYNGDQSLADFEAE